jgi:hypothetical protein
MANIMYLTEEVQLSLGQQRPFMLGASVPTVRNRKDRNIDQAVQERRGLAITWRRDQILKQALNILNPGAELSALEPSVLMKLQNRLHFLVLGKANPKSKTGNPAEKPLSEDFFKGMAMQTACLIILLIPPDSNRFFLYVRLIQDDIAQDLLSRHEPLGIFIRHPQEFTVPRIPEIEPLSGVP